MSKKEHEHEFYKIKSKNLIVSKKITPKGNILTIKRYRRYKKDPIYLADVFHETPSGFIYKDETGMGATTLELKSKRNSIIVEPIKITSSSKAYKHDALYVGSSTKFHPDKTTSKKQITNYISRADIKYKKILVVADSLYKVIEVIGSDVYKDYFLLIDEIDSFQLDSTYRKSMEITLDYYKLFGVNNRAMLSATRIDFSDPVLSQERITFIKYSKPKPRNISVISTNRANLQGVSIDVINKLLTDYPDQKIFVAYNSIMGLLSMADHLVQSGQASKDDIKILCSSASAGAVGEYFYELDSDKLPAQINLFTSAYFTGFDLKESYHLVSISGNSNRIQALSDRRLKQIAGRCRDGLLSETIIHDVYTFKENELETSKESLLEAAKIQADAMACNRKHYSKSAVLKEVLDEINSKILTFLDSNNLRFVREDNLGNIVTSYLNIDAQLESIRVRNTLYKTKNALKDKLLEDGNTVTHKFSSSGTLIEKSNSFVDDRDSQIEKVIGFLEQCQDESQISNHLRNEKLSPLQRLITKEYLKIYSFVDAKKMLDMIKKSLIKTRDNRRFNLLMQSAEFHINPKGNIAVDRLDFHFPIQQGKGTSSPKERLTKTVVKQRMRMYLTELGNPIQNLSEAKAIRLLNVLRKVYRKRDPKTKVDYYVVSKSNPLKIPVTKMKPIIHGEDIFNVFIAGNK